MSSRAPQGSQKAALQGLLRDARDEPAPELDWARIEARLPRQGPRPAPQVRSTPHPVAWGVFAVAAMAAVWAVGVRPSASVSQTPKSVIEAAATQHQNGDVLALGSRVEANMREVSVEHSGRATWTLSANSSALLTGKDEERIKVRLERGSVLSQVVPNAQPETFVVEAAGTRVAVHGTVFRVALAGERVLVQVREGTVAVGPLGSPPAFLLKAPASGDFARDGRSGTIDGRTVSETDARRAERLKVPRNGSSAAVLGSALTPIQSAQLPSEPSISEIEAGIERIVEATSECFNRHTQSAEGVQITAHTAVSLRILDSGAIAEVDFQPPLSPDAEQCAATRIAELRFVPSKQGAKVTRMLELKR